MHTQDRSHRRDGPGRAPTWPSMLWAQGHEVVPIARSMGVDVITGEGLDAALAGVDPIVDTATGPSPDEQEAHGVLHDLRANLHRRRRAGGRPPPGARLDHRHRPLQRGYMAAKLAQEQAPLAGPIPTRILRAAQFHEFVGAVPRVGPAGRRRLRAAMQTQLVAARAVAEGLAELVVDSEPTGPTLEVAGPRAERLVELARMLAAHRGEALQVVETTDYFPESEIYDSDAPLPGPDAKLAGPTFEEWLTG